MSDEKIKISGKAAGVAEKVVKKALEWFPDVVRIKLDEEDYLECNVKDYFDRLQRQGWTCFKRKKIKDLLE